MRTSSTMSTSGVGGTWRPVRGEFLEPAEGLLEVAVSVDDAHGHPPGRATTMEGPIGPPDLSGECPYVQAPPSIPTFRPTESSGRDRRLHRLGIPRRIGHPITTYES